MVTGVVCGPAAPLWTSELTTGIKLGITIVVGIIYVIAVVFIVGYQLWVSISASNRMPESSHQGSS